MRFEKLDYVDPIKLYSVLREHSYSFILESADKHEKKAKYTYLSCNPEFVVEIGERGVKVDGEFVSKEKNPFKALKLFDLPDSNERFSGGFVGYIPYDAVYNYIGGKIIENAVFGFYKDYFVYDHVTNNLYSTMKDADKIVSKAKRVKIEKVKGGSNIICCDAEKEEFVDIVEKGKEFIYNGDVFQVVLSREYRIKTDLSPFEIYLNLRNINPSPYMFCIEFEKSVVGASPETMASVENAILKVNPIAGTAERGKSLEEDDRIAEKLLKDEKERAEHVMLVDLARNDVRKVSKAGSVRVVKFMEVVRYSHVQHIESEVTGEIDDGKTAFDAMEACFPAGTLTGAPKLRAMEIIERLEKSKRRIYGGCVGYFSKNCSDMAIAIRLAEIDKICRVRAGAGIVADSIPEREFLETEKKMKAVLNSLEVME